MQEVEDAPERSLFCPWACAVYWKKGRTEGNTGNRLPLRLPLWPAGTFLCRGGKASDSGQGEQFHAAPLEGGQMPEPCLPGQFPGPLEIPPYILRPVGV